MQHVAFASALDEGPLHALSETAPAQGLLQKLELVYRAVAKPNNIHCVLSTLGDCGD